MPKAAPYRLTWVPERGIYALRDDQQSEQTLPVVPGSQEWFAWLTSIPSFTFSGEHGQLTVRQEARGGGGVYWYAYRRRGEKMLKRYLGRTADLTPAHLEEVARELAAPSASHPKQEPPARDPLQETAQAEHGFQTPSPKAWQGSVTDRVGQQLGNYRLLRLLGRGGQASVYLGEHVYLKSYAALKMLHAHLTDQDVHQFVQEAQILARLSHPHIVRILDFAVQEGQPFLVMDYVPGGTLRTLHPRDTRLPLSTIAAYVTQVASALQYAHDQHLIHRDIKPENMLLGPHSEVLLSDFGLAMLAPQSQSYSTQVPAQPPAGTASYLAPEQVQGQPRPASDQYALGIVVYEWLCGTPLTALVPHDAHRCFEGVLLPDFGFAIPAVVWLEDDLLKALPRLFQFVVNAPPPEQVWPSNVSTCPQS